MRKLLLPLTLAALIAPPVQAADWQNQAADVRAGAFVGARVQLPFGGKSLKRPRAALTLSPTMSRLSASGAVRTTIGEGLAINLTPRSKPTLTLAGIRADTALGLRPQGEVDAGRKQGISTGGWVAIGVGAALVVGGVYVLHVLEETEEDRNSD